jgi:hypothetical protein
MLDPVDAAFIMNQSHLLFYVQPYVLGCSSTFPMFLFQNFSTYAMAFALIPVFRAVMYVTWSPDLSMLCMFSILWPVCSIVCYVFTCHIYCVAFLPVTLSDDMSFPVVH